MKRILLSLAIALVLIGGNFVLRHIHIRGIENTIGVISHKLSENGLKFSYEKIHYDNFAFWKIDGQIINPVLVQEKHRYSDKSTFEYIAFTSTLIGKKVTIKLPSKINTLINDDQGEHQYISTFTTNPQINISFNGYFMTHNEFLKQKGLAEYFTRYVNYLYYRSSGHKAIKVNNSTNTDELIYTIGSFDMKIKNQGTEKYDDCKIEIQLNEVKYNETSFGEGYFGLLAEVGESNYILDANLLFNFKDEAKIALNDTIILDNIKPTHKLKINNFQLLTEPYSLEISGNAVANRTKILPYFDIDIGVVNFDNMLEFYSKFYNTLVPKIDIMRVLSLRTITEKQKKAISGMFREIAERSKNEGYTININQLKEKPIKIGKYTLDQVVEMYNDLVNEKKENISRLE